MWVEGGETLTTDGPFAEAKEHLAVHADASTFEETDWSQIVVLSPQPRRSRSRG